MCLHVYININVIYFEEYQKNANKYRYICTEI